MNRLTSLLALAALSIPLFASAADSVTIPRFLPPPGWSRVSAQDRVDRKPILYLRQSYALSIMTANGAAAYLSAQNLPAYREGVFTLADADALFEKTSQLDGDELLGDAYIPNVRDLKTSTGTLFGHQSREFIFNATPTTTTYYYRMSYATIDGKLVGLEMATVKDTDEHDGQWADLIRASNAETRTESSSSSSRSSTSSSSSSSSAVTRPATSLSERTCERVRRWFGDSEILRARVNERLLRRFGFSC